MDRLTQSVFTGAAGAAGAGPLYVEDVFSTYLYTGNGSSQTITNGIDLSGEGGLVWVKKRSGSQNHRLQDTVQGITKSGISNTINAYVTSATRVTSVSSTGFSVGNDSDVNENTYTYTSWTFRKQAKFFDVVTYTGDGTAGRTVSHNLGSVPGFIIVKSTSASANWVCYHRSLGNGYAIYLDLTEGQDGPNKPSWNQTSPTSTEFTVGADGWNTNNTGTSYVAYLFAHDAGGFGEDETESVIKCGSYTGTGAVGNFINLGWEPQWVLVKKASGGNANNYNWTIVDNMRGAPVLQVNSVCPYLHPNTSGAESLDYPISPSPTGFIVNNPGSLVNDSGATFIYIAIRRPHKPPEAATDVFALEAVTAAYQNEFNTGFPVDMTIAKYRPGSYRALEDRLRGYNPVGSTAGYPQLRPDSTDAEITTDGPFIYAGDSNTSVRYGVNVASADLITWAFRRAPGFFDMVAYTGTGVARTVDHNLGVVPELMIVKNRSVAGNTWRVYAPTVGPTAALALNNTNAKFTNIGFWNDTAPTSSSFTVGTVSNVNSSGVPYIAYLFATLSGISKVGSYSGTGNDINVDCGFTAGARFVLIKRTDSTGDWYVWDSTRGIVSGNDPYLLLNSTAAEVTSTDYIDPLNSGFTVTSSAPAELNASGGTYIFLAIA